MQGGAATGVEAAGAGGPASSATLLGGEKFCSESLGFGMSLPPFEMAKLLYWAWSLGAAIWYDPGV